MRKKGFSLVELMVVVAIIAILTAIALPMYSNFRRRATTQNAIAPCNDVRKALMAFYDDSRSFQNIGFVAGTSGPIQAFHTGVGGVMNVGSGLPPAQGITWILSSDEISAGRVSRATIEFQFDPEVCAGCSGFYCILCDIDSVACIYEVDVDDTNDPGNPLNSLDKNRGTACDLDSVAAAEAVLNP
ncbi:prepilin-type N-terminal cleavage/methylation domain-containing protein [Acanthopleuribacter pedis]|nr:prepilin-type N-terminal cleavage/methylation domain-containing protein [Acanthopleuribacter pedis]